MLDVLLLFLLARRFAEDRQENGQAAGRCGTLPWTRPDAVPASAASLFAVHPMTESVGYISGRAEVLCTTFFPLGFLSLRRWIEIDRGRWLALSVQSPSETGTSRRARLADAPARPADPRILWLDAVQKAPDLWLPHMLLGEALHARGLREQA
jgi:hypothetical protein